MKKHEYEVVGYTWSPRKKGQKLKSAHEIKTPGRKTPTVDKKVGELTMDFVKDPEAITAFKKLCVTFKSYELAAHLRDLERQCYPKRVSGTKEKVMANDIVAAAKMIDVNMDEKMAFMIESLIKAVRKKKGKFSISDAVEIQHAAKEIFW